MSTTLGTAFIANNSGNEILFCSSPDGVNWSADTETHQSSKAAPSLAVFKFNYLLAFLANNSTNEILACSSTNGVDWSNDIQVHQSSKASPSLACSTTLYGWRSSPTTAVTRFSSAPPQMVCAGRLIRRCISPARLPLSGSVQQQVMVSVYC